MSAKITGGIVSGTWYQGETNSARQSTCQSVSLSLFATNGVPNGARSIWGGIENPVTFTAAAESRSLKLASTQLGEPIEELNTTLSEHVADAMRRALMGMI